MNALVNPSSRQIAAQVDVVLQHDPTASVIGIRAQSGGTWPSSIRVGNRDFAVAWCASPIAIREHLLNLSDQSSQDPPPGLVVMTPLPDKALGSDVLSRFARGKVFSVEAWDMVRHAFQAMDIDSRLARWPWVGEALLENLPASGYPPARGGLLDVDTAWFHVLRTVLGLAPDQGTRPDLGSIIRWSLSPGATQRYDALPEKARKQIRLWLAEVLGGCGELVGQILDAGYGGELAPIALVAGMVLQNESGYPRSDAETRELLAASVRLERFTGGQPVTARDALRLHAAAVQVTAAMDASDLLPVLDVADRILETLHLTSLAHVSDDLPSGLNGRLVKFAAAVEAFVDLLRQDQSERRTTQVAKAVAELLLVGKHITSHRMALHHAPRIRRVDMAVRLARWMAAEVELPGCPPGNGLAALVRAYAEDGSFVDAARLALLGGDELSSLSRAFAVLRDEARKRRDSHNEAFARALKGWNASGCPDLTGIVPVESVVATVAAPTAAVAPILVLLVDGLSYPIFRELIDDAQRQGWNEVLPPGVENAFLGLATIPSVTEISRTSLFCGQILQGQAANEKTGFANHPSLAAIAPPGRGSARAVLFHKGDLTAGGDGSSLSDVVRDAIASRERKVVGVVFNAIDDHLSGSDQLNQRWSLDDLRLIKPLLYEARNAGRLVIVTADHGHVIDEATQLMSGQVGDGGSGGDRWRTASGTEPGAGEMLFSGGRVKSPSGDNQVVVPWSESVRFGSKKNGYHGGVSLQEMVVPVALLATGMSLPDGLRHAPCKVPAWWDLVSEPEQVQVEASANVGAATPPRKTKTVSSSDTRQTSLFEMPAPIEAPEIETVAKSDWIDTLLQSNVFKAQKQWASRAGVRDEEIRQLLQALDERGGKLSKSALAGRLAMPMMRISGFVNAARRLLNVDQAPILVLDEVEGSVMLNLSLLEIQFQVKGRQP